MTADAPERPAQDPEAELERALIDEFLRANGQDQQSLERLPEPERRHLLEAASVYAAGKLSEIQARAHFVQELHHGE